MRRRVFSVLSILFVFCVSFAAPLAAQTRTAGAQPGPSGYVEASVQSSFGSVTSQSYGGEFGYTVWENVQVFAEIAGVRNVATSEITAGAQAIAAALTQLQPATVTDTVKQPVTLFDAGVRYPFVMPGGKITPYVLGGFGVARVSNDVKFQLGGVDASSTLAQFVTIGTDLSGSETKAALTLGAGAQWPAWKQLVIDLQYRYGRVFADTNAINIHRAGIGVGVVF